MEKLRYGCVGAGRISRKKHLTGYSELKNRVELCAVCDLDRPMAEQLAKDFGIKHVYTDYQEMLKKEQLDIVSVCTPNFTHMPITCYALECGCNVHLEKPIALNEAEARKIAEAEQKSGKQVMLGLNKRFIGQTVMAQELIGMGFFGEIYRASCGWERNSGIPGIGRWFTDKRLSGGGALIDLGVHYLDLTLSLMGYPKAEAVSGTIYSKFGEESRRIRRGYRSVPGGIYDVEDMASGIVRLETGALLDFEFSWASNIEKEVRYVEIMGTKGGLKAINDQFSLYTQIGGTMFTLVPDAATTPQDLNECEHFVDCIQAGRRVITTTEQGIKMMKIIDGLYESAERNTEIKLNFKEEHT